MQETFFWHDYETFGTDPQRDKVVQFAGVRTDLDFNIIDSPVMLYCKPADDCLPHPEACLITGITPQLAMQQGIPEAEFAHEIHTHLSKANTCTVGYNNIRFDDEVTRNLLYRNFYDPYAREWQNGNSRWDLIDVVRATYALRPDGIIWPENEDGQVSLRLELLTAANGIQHAAAHDALSDVYATIAIARLIRTQQPKLYHYLFTRRSKQTAENALKLGSLTPVAHVSGMYSMSRYCLAIVVALAKHPSNNNGIIVYDLSVNPEALLDLSIEEIKKRLFTAKADLPEGVERIPLKTVHLNKCPVIAPYNVIREQDAARLALDKSIIQHHLTLLKQHPDIAEKVAAVFETEYDQTPTDPDLMLYSGGFFSPHDKREMSKVRQTPPDELRGKLFDFKDMRLPEMLIRYKGRNYPQTLTEAEQQQWWRYCLQVLTDSNIGSDLTLEQFKQTLCEYSDQQPHSDIIKALFEYADQKEVQMSDWQNAIVS